MRGNTGKALGIVAAVGIVAGAVWSNASFVDADGPPKPVVKPKYTLEEIMKKGHGKDGIFKKVLRGKATDKEKALLLDYYVVMYESKPPRGKIESWTKLTGDALAAAAKVVLKQKGAENQLKRAGNCKPCHRLHKPD